MRILEHTSSRLVVKFNVIFAWILATAGCGFGIIWGILAWTSPQYGGSFEQNIVFSLFCLFIFLISLPLFFKPTTVVTFDKGNGSFTQEKIWLWKTEVIQHSIQLIKDVQVVQKGRFGKARTYFKIIVELDSGEQLPLHSGNYRPEVVVRRVGDVIRTFLELT